MKKYLLIVFVIFLLSSCIKVEDVNICPNAPPAPSLATTSITLPANQTYDTLKVINPDASGVYAWFGPYGLNYTGVSVRTPVIYGNWSVVERKNSCTSDTTRFTILPSLASCGVGYDTFFVSGSLPYNMRLVNIYNEVSYYGYYEIVLQSYNGYTMDIYFPGIPATGQYSLTSSNNYYSLSAGQCAISFGSNLSSYSGEVYITGTGNNITLQFCNAVFYNSYNYSYPNASGYFIGI